MAAEQRTIRDFGDPWSHYLVERLRKTLLGRTARRRARFPGADWVMIPVDLFEIVPVRAVRAG